MIDPGHPGAGTREPRVYRSISEFGEADKGNTAVFGESREVFSFYSK
jgi:hypothetical protein